MTQKEWFEEWFDETYLEVYQHRNEEEAKKALEFVIKALELASQDKILDLCCGAGRHSLALANAGFENVLGVDLSSILIAKAKEEAEKNNLKINFEICDMRHLPYKNEFDVVLSFFTSFGYFENDSENETVISSISQVLKPGGKVFMDHINSEFQTKNLVPYSERELEGMKIIEKRKIEDSRVKKDITIIKDDGNEKTYSESVRLYSPEELENMFGKYDIRIYEKFGNYDGTPFTPNSLRMILIGKRS